MNRLLTFLIALVFMLSSYSSAETFKNITYQLPKDHYIVSRQNISNQALVLYSNDIGSTDNIIIQITPTEEDYGYFELKDKDVDTVLSAFSTGFLQAQKGVSLSELADSLGIPLNEHDSIGLTLEEYKTILTNYKNSMKINSIDIVNATKLNCPTIKYILTANIWGSDFIQTGFCIPNGRNYYYICFTGNYSIDEMNSFLKTIDIKNFVSKNDSFWDNSLVQAFIRGTAIALALGFWQAIGVIFNKKKQKSSLENIVEENPYIYNPNLNNTENLKAKFSQMNIETLKKLIDTQKDDYTEEAYNIALEQYKLRSADSQIPDSKVQELQEQIKQLENALISLNKMLAQAKKDLGNLTIDDVENMYRQNLISEQQKNEMINSIEVLQTTIEMTPQNILTTEKIKAELEEELKKLQEV